MTNLAETNIANSEETNVQFDGRRTCLSELALALVADASGSPHGVDVAGLFNLISNRRVVGRCLGLGGTALGPSKH